jgi:23S rRNA-/tRNA-specific pseudouridylate synthase
MGPRVHVLDAREGWVAVHKPAGIPSEPAPGFPASVTTLAARELGVDATSVHVLGRLDVPVSGVVLLVTTADARRRGAALQARHALGRRYVALLAARPEPVSGVWVWAIGRGRGRRVAGGSDADQAVTAYAAVAVAPAGPALVTCELRTGRTHQIRVHASTAGVPILLDKRYGARGQVVGADGRVLAPGRIALHSARVVVPLSSGAWTVVSPPEPELGPLWAALGGSADAFSSALEVPVPPWDGSAS